LRIGQNTLSIYVIHFIILYGSFTGLGLYRFFHHSLSPSIVVPGAILFMVICSYTALWYERNEQLVRGHIGRTIGQVGQTVEPYIIFFLRNVRIALYRLLRSINTRVKP
jgi:hypothetical protein